MSVNFMKVHQPNLPPQLRAQIPVEVQICRLRRGGRHPHRAYPRQGPRTRPRQEYLCLLDDRQRRLAGRLPRRRVHAVPWHQGHPSARAATAFRPLPGAPRSRLESGTTISSAASTSWPRLRRSQARNCPKRIVKANPSSSTATTCRRCSSERANATAAAGSTSPKMN